MIGNSGKNVEYDNESAQTKDEADFSTRSCPTARSGAVTPELLQNGLPPDGASPPSRERVTHSPCLRSDELSKAHSPGVRGYE